MGEIFSNLDGHNYSLRSTYDYIFYKVSFFDDRFSFLVLKHISLYEVNQNYCTQPATKWNTKMFEGQINCYTL
jgi:hypothetical protein